MKKIREQKSPEKKQQDAIKHKRLLKKIREQKSSDKKQQDAIKHK